MTHALFWARSLAALKAEEGAISMCVDLAQEEYIAALERLTKRRLTHSAESKEHARPHDIAQSEQPDRDESVTQVHVEEGDEIVHALDKTTLESFDMEL